MRLLHVFSSFAVGGAQVRFCTLAGRLDPDWHHDIVALDGNTACRERLAPGLRIGFPAAATPRGDTLGAIRVARRALRTLRPDVLVTYNWGAIEWAMANALTGPARAGRRHVHIEDGFGPEERTRQIPRRVWTRRLVLRQADVVLPSRTLLRIATEQWRLPQRRLHYIPNGIDLDRFAAAPDRPATATPTIGTVAALRPEKNVARLVRAFAALCRDRAAGYRPRLTIVGDGPDREALERLADTLGIAAAVHFAGHQPDPRAAYRGFDVFALSSDTEQMPLSVLEAMAAALPVAATDVGDVAAMLAEPNRRFVTPLEVSALAAALAALVDDAALRRSLGAANRTRVEHEYDEAAMVRSYAALLVRKDWGSAPNPAGAMGPRPHLVK